MDTVILVAFLRGLDDLTTQPYRKNATTFKTQITSLLTQIPTDSSGQATALVHEAYIRLVDVDKVQHWDSRGHFFSAAAEAMRRILVENARRKGSSKHGGNVKRVDFDEACSLCETSSVELLAVNEALDSLAQEDPIKAELVKLRCFAGLSHQEAAEALGISRATADRYWSYAKVHLYCEIYEPDETPLPQNNSPQM